MLIRNREGDVRLARRLVLLVLPFLMAAYLLRHIPIRIHTELLINQGLSRSRALSRARYLILEDPAWSSVVGIIQGLLWYPITRFLVSAVERRPFSPDDLGFSPRRGDLLLIPLGGVLASIMYLGAFWVGGFFNEAVFSWSPPGLNTTTIALVSLDLGTNALGEETAFLAYFQDRLIKRQGLWLGIALASSSFVLLHLLIYRFSGPSLVASILLAAIYGTLYVSTGPIYLVGTMHAVFNLAPRLLNQWPPDVELILAHVTGLVIVVILFAGVSKPEEEGRTSMLGLRAGLGIKDGGTPREQRGDPG